MGHFSTAAIFAGGLIAGIYPTSSYDITAHICKTGDVDILLVENLDLLKQAVGGKSSLKDALPTVKTVVLIDSTQEDIEAGNSEWYFFISITFWENAMFDAAKVFGHVISWNDLKALGSTLSNSKLEERESYQQVNKACMVLFTSGTTGLPKGEGEEASRSTKS